MRDTQVSFQGTLDRLRDEMGAEMTASEVAHCGTDPGNCRKILKKR